MAWRILNPFIKSGEVLRLIGAYKTLECPVKPSDIMGIEDSYTAFCFDEACAFIIKELKDGKKPIMRVENNSLVYKRPSDLYNRFKNN